MLVLLPKSIDLDPITCTWLRGLVATALELGIRPLCWHIEHGTTGSTATGYVTMTLLDAAPEIRKDWADALGLHEITDDQGRSTGFAGQSGRLTICLPDAVDPDEHCRICNVPLDPWDTRPDGRAPVRNGDVCRGCASDTPNTGRDEYEAQMRKTRP